MFWSQLIRSNPHHSPITCLAQSSGDSEVAASYLMGRIVGVIPILILVILVLKALRRK